MYKVDPIYTIRIYSLPKCMYKVDPIYTIRSLPQCIYIK